MRRKFFLKRAFSFCVVMLLPTIFLFILFTGMKIHSIEREIRADGEQDVEVVSTNIDLVVNNVLSQNDFLAGTTRMSSAMKRLMNQENIAYTDVIYLNSLRSMMASVIETSDYISGVMFYLEDGERFFNSEHGIQLFDPESREWLQAYQNLADDQKSDVFAGEDTGEQNGSAYIIQRLLIKKGCVVVKIDLERFERILNSFFSNEYENIYVLNSKGEIIAESKKNAYTVPDLFFQNQVMNQGTSLKKILSQNTEEWMWIEGGQYRITYRTMEDPEIYVVSLISRDMETSAILDTVRQFALILLVNIIIVILLAYRTTRRSFHQIDQVLQMFDAAENKLEIKKPDGPEKDEYDVIMNNIIFMFLKTSALNVQLQEEKFRQEIAELKALQLQINPHFLYNTLQTLDLEVRKNKLDTAYISGIIQKLSDILKYSFSDTHEVTLNEEISYLKKYIGIQKYRFEDRFIIYYEIDEEAENAGIFRLMLQPMVENSLLHGIRGIERKGYIKVKARVRNGSLRIDVIDNGIGMTREEVQALTAQINASDSRNVGLTNVNRRLILRYGRNAALHILSKPGMGTDIYFRIPYTQEKNS